MVDLKYIASIIMWTIAGITVLVQDDIYKVKLCYLILLGAYIITLMNNSLDDEEE